MNEEMKEIMQERLDLVLERIKEIKEEHFGQAEYEKYFMITAKFILMINENRLFIEKGGLQTAPISELAERNHKLYEDILPDHYEESYANPAFAVQTLGKEFGPMLAFLSAELRSLIGFSYDGRLLDYVIRMELFVEVYGAFTGQWQENEKLPDPETVQKILYWFVSDYADIAAQMSVAELVVPTENLPVKILKEALLTDVRYLYAYGEYISDSELTMARFMASLPEETIRTMADTYTEGYRIGFELGNKDLSKKSTVELLYQLGFERMMRAAVENFAKMGLAPVTFRAAVSILYNPSLYKRGFFGANPNRQFDFDHKDDKALFLDKNYINRKLEVSKTAFEEYKEQALKYAGPAVVETFGEKNFEPVNKPEALSMTEEQNALWVEYRTRAGELQREYILEEERSFTIIAFPVPEIGACFPELFKEIIRINTLDYTLYRDIQQIMIDALNTADYCEIKGCNGNRTNMKVRLHKLADPSKETIFENCVADVNIPVGEVFTSPVLSGTDGILHVSRVFLNDLEYRDLEITFENGMIKNYNCANFAKKEENQAFIRENILFRHKTLPLGEFAIGTNTTAYVVAKKFQVEDKFPILIAEKMGPHFAVGDTCYSHAEDIRVYNPDGKEIVAKDNEVSLLRNTRPEKAYFNCHTDITIPYDELGELTAVQKDGNRIPIIVNGKFVLPGCEKLNKPLEEMMV